MMKRNKTKFFLLIFLLFSMTSLSSDIAWDPESTYIIPADGNLYYLDSHVALTSDLTINGTFFIGDSFMLTSSLGAIYNNHVLTLTGGLVDLTNGMTVYNDHLITVSMGIFLLERACFYNGYSSTGTVRMTGGNFDFILGSTFVNGHNYFGSIDVIGGTFGSDGFLYNGGDALGGICISGGAFLHCAGILHNGGTSAGKIDITDGTFLLSGGDINNGVTPAGDINLYGGYFIKSALGTLYDDWVAPGTIHMLGGTTVGV